MWPVLLHGVTDPDYWCVSQVYLNINNDVNVHCVIRGSEGLWGGALSTLPQLMISKNILMLLLLLVVVVGWWWGGVEMVMVLVFVLVVDGGVCVVVVVVGGGGGEGIMCSGTSHV